MEEERLSRIKQAGKEMRGILGFDTFPVGVRFLKDEAYPEGVKILKQHRYCQALI
jgi:uncharacterized protein (DUF169 family)